MVSARRINKSDPTLQEALYLHYSRGWEDSQALAQNNPLKICWAIPVPRYYVLFVILQRVWKQNLQAKEGRYPCFRLRGDVGGVTSVELWREWYDYSSFLFLQKSLKQKNVSYIPLRWTDISPLQTLNLPGSLLWNPIFEYASSMHWDGEDCGLLILRLNALKVWIYIGAENILNLYALSICCVLCIGVDG